MSQENTPSLKTTPQPHNAFLHFWLPAMLWGAASAMLVFTVLVGLYGKIIVSHDSIYQKSNEVAVAAVSNAPEIQIQLPSLTVMPALQGLTREIQPHTVVASQPRREVVKYTVEKKDSIFGISNKFKLKPETILWANTDVLKDNPDTLTPGQILNIPPIDGVYYQWKEKDTLDSVANVYKVKTEDIVLYSPNKLDMTSPAIKPETYVMIPGGKREMKSAWVMPTIPRGRSGVTNVMGKGGCDVGEDGAYGTGTFIYPTREPRLSGNDYWSGHLALDLATGVGDPIHASDSGVVVYSGWAGGGYGNVVVIDHGNGYQTLYAHNSSVVARCGASVQQGGLIAYGGSTGNSTGPHLHFEIRYLGGFINPWYVLP